MYVFLERLGILLYTVLYLSKETALKLVPVSGWATLRYKNTFIVNVVFELMRFDLDQSHYSTYIGNSIASLTYSQNGDYVWVC
jgi:hypothetical protein